MSLAGMQITALRASDYDRWFELYHAYQAFYKRALPNDVYVVTWQRLLDDTAAHALVARTAEGGIMGIAHFLFHASVWAGPSCYLQDLFVAPEARARGCGRALIEAVAERARAHRCDRYYWLTQDFNATARRLYDTLAVNNHFIRYDYVLNP